MSIKSLLQIILFLLILMIIGGIYFWGKTTSKFIKRSLKKEEINNLIDICAVYWHFLLVVWLVLFGLMLTS